MRTLPKYKEMVSVPGYLPVHDPAGDRRLFPVDLPDPGGIQEFSYFFFRLAFLYRIWMVFAGESPVEDSWMSKSRVSSTRSFSFLYP